MIKHSTLTREQMEALRRVYLRDTSVARSYRAFRRTARMSYSMDCLMVKWKNMWLGIEKDGYTHS